MGLLFNLINVVNHYFSVDCSNMSSLRQSLEGEKHESGDRQPLISRSEEATEEQTQKLLWNFYFMCVCFSANHGCVVACIAYASSELGDLLGGYGKSN